MLSLAYGIYKTWGQNDLLLLIVEDNLAFVVRRNLSKSGIKWDIIMKVKSYI